MEQPRAKKTSVTVADVARVAGVSKATAARVLGGYGIVSPKVRESVMVAAKDLDYRPNELARSMTTGRSGAIGVVVGDIENSFFSAALRGISDAAHASGYTVILVNSGEEVEAEKAAIWTLLARRVDGLIVTPARSFEVDHLAEIGRSGRPLALLDRAVPGLEVDTVTVDDRDASENATDLLIARGHRRIAFLTACDTPDHRLTALDEIPTASVRARIAGFLSACSRAGIERAEEGVRLGANGGEAMRRFALDLLREAARPTAILASDSTIALEVFKAARELGLAIPGDLSLITFHDADWTGVTSPAITVIDQPVYRLGKEVAELLLRRLRGEEGPPRSVVVPTRLIERGSVAAPSSV